MNDNSHYLYFSESFRINHIKKLDYFSANFLCLLLCFYQRIEKLTLLDLITRRYDNVLLALPTLKKHQRRNKDGNIINKPDPEHGDNWTSLENELNQWERELSEEVDEEPRIFLETRIKRIKDQIRKRGYAPESLSDYS